MEKSPGQISIGYEETESDGVQEGSLTKSDLRVMMLKRRAALKAEEAEHLSKCICECLFSHSLFQQADTVYFYYPIRNEVSLLPLAELALKTGKQIGFPGIRGDSMDFYRVTSLYAFQWGAFGIPEPDGGIDNLLTVLRPLILTPGVAFDKQKHRIGYGKGFYDRYGARFPDASRIGVAYGFQVVEQIQVNQYDLPMQEIVTEAGI